MKLEYEYFEIRIRVFWHFLNDMEVHKMVKNRDKYNDAVFSDF